MTKFLRIDAIYLASFINVTFLFNYALWYVGADNIFKYVNLFGLLLLVVVWYAVMMKSYRIYWPLIIIFTLLLFEAMGSPTTAWDARSIWLFHAKRIFIDNDLFAQLDNYAPWSHNDYPVLSPSLSATFALAVGNWNEIFPKVANIFLILPPLLIVASIVRSQYLLSIFLLGIIIICGRYLRSGHMDAVLSLHVLCVLILFTSLSFDWSRYLRAGKVASIMLLASSLSIVALLKNEGLVVYVVLVCLTIFCLMFNIGHMKIKTALCIFCPPLIFLISWKVAIYLSGVSNDLTESEIFHQLYARALNIDNWKLIASYLLTRIWVVYFMILLCSISYFKLSPNLKGSVIIVLCFSLIYVAVLYFVYLMTPHDLAWHLKTSAMRVVLPVNVLLFGYALILGRAIHDHYQWLICRAEGSPDNSIE